MNETKRKLFALYLRHDSTFRSLSTYALSQIILKILYIKSDSITFSEIRKDIHELFSNDIPDKEITESLDDLLSSNKIDLSGGAYKVCNEYSKKIDRIVSENDSRKSRVIENWFGNSAVPINELINWFDDVTIAFFENFKYEWIYELDGLNGGANNKIDLSDILKKSFIEHSQIVERNRVYLIEMYQKFILGENDDARAILWGYGTAMFAATLIHSKSYHDKFSNDMFNSSVFVLDTNVLVLLSLDGSEFSSSIEALENILLNSNISAKYFQISKEEYLGVLDRKKYFLRKMMEFSNEIQKKNKG